MRRKRRKVHGPGKTRDEMVREARAAYQRREEELAQRRLDVVQGTKSGENRRERSWWEAMGLDGAMSTVHEERSNPMEDVEVSSKSSDNETDSTRIGTLPSREVSKEKEVKEGPTGSAPIEVGETDGSSA